MLNHSQLEISLNDIIGTGEFGTVFNGKYCGLNVAIKKLEMPENINQSAKEDLEFELSKEIETLEKMRHPNIVSMLASDKTFIIMELYDSDASDIGSYLELSIVARDCMSALLYMQTSGECTMHGDIKPQNILVQRNNHGRIIKASLGDMGLARTCNLYTNWQGTPGYMPEENPYVNSTHDIFALIVSVLDGYFHKRVSAAFDSLFVNNVWGFIEQLPADILSVSSRMYVMYEHSEMAEKDIIRHKFMRIILDDWVKSVDSYQKTPDKGTNEEMRSYDPLSGSE